MNNIFIYELLKYNKKYVMQISKEIKKKNNNMVKNKIVTYNGDDYNDIYNNYDTYTCNYDISVTSSNKNDEGPEFSFDDWNNI